MLKRYLEQATYRYKIYATFYKNGFEHIVVSEKEPSGEESNLFILRLENNKIYNENDTLCAIINNKEIEIIEP